jgi:DNA-binding CsgD family transcriptional regulator
MLNSERVVVVVDDERRYLVASNPAVALIGASPRAMLRSRLDDHVPPEHRPALESAWAELRRDGAISGKAQVLRRGAARATVELRGTWNFGPGQHLIVVRRADHPARGRDSTPTTREREVLQLAADGLTTPEIAARMMLSPATVRTHFENAYPKLGARNRASAVAEALRRRLIH